MRSASPRPAVIASVVGSPRRSSKALVATVVPILTASIALAGIGASAPGAAAAGCPRAPRLVLLGLSDRSLCGSRRRRARHHVGEGAAAIDPELPGRCAPDLGHRRSRPLGGKSTHLTVNTGRRACAQAAANDLADQPPCGLDQQRSARRKHSACRSGARSSAASPGSRSTAFGALLMNTSSTTSGPDCAAPGRCRPGGRRRSPAARRG